MMIPRLRMLRLLSLLYRSLYKVGLMVELQSVLTEMESLRELEDTNYGTPNSQVH